MTRYFPNLRLFIATVTVVCLTSAGSVMSNDASDTTLSDFIKNQDYAGAKKLLDQLYAEYPASADAEASFVRNVGNATTNLQYEHDEQLQAFIDRYPNHLSVDHFSANYLYAKGTKARGEKTILKTSKDQLASMRSEMEGSVTAFKGVLEENPNDYLALVSNGVNYSYMGAYRKADNEFRKALDLNAASYQAWSNLLWFNHPRWGGSYQKLENLLEEMEAQIGTNPKLASMQGVIYADKADAAIGREQFDEAETLVLQAFEYGSYWRYRRVADDLHRKIQASGDRAGACRISIKVNELDPTNEHYQNLVESC